jgi:RNA polymerase sigma-70 factor, ECF subfamily
VKQLSSPDRWLEEHGDVLFGFALLRVRDRATAEDLVQETLLAAWRGREGFAGGSTERTWLIGILKHKLTDHWRRSSRETQSPGLSSADTDGPDIVEQLFDNADNEHWRVQPSAWNHPDAALEQQEFWRIFADCLAALPPAQAQAFSLCELDGLEGPEACKVLAVAPTNLWVILHRARLRLRQCLENNWFEHKPQR